MKLPLPTSVRRRLFVPVGFVVVLVVAALGPAAAVGRPDALTDADFWRLTVDLSEPGGHFRSDNLVSNEMVFPRVVPEVLRRTKVNGVYLGVGPEQNFTYIAAMRPRIAFILDIRRGNLQLQLLYKALFELSADRAEFISRLFNRLQPAGLDRQASAQELFTAIAAAPLAGDAAYRANLRAVFDILYTQHDLALSEDDRDGIEFVYGAFRRYGPYITWNSSTRGVVGGRATYVDLMTHASESGAAMSYLASEEKFRIVKDLQARNMIVPVVGDFAGHKALRAIGQYLREQDSVLGAFYVSNVESYLRQDDKWLTFCANVASMPIDDDSVFIRPMGVAVTTPTSWAGPDVRILSHSTMTPLATPLGPIASEVRGCAPVSDPR
jgi:hypothetical protein